MLQFIAHHHFWIAVAAYWIFCAAVSALPEPADNGSPVYFDQLVKNLSDLTDAIGKFAEAHK